MKPNQPAFMTKDDKIDLIKQLYIANLVPFLATVGSILAILKFVNS